MKQWKKAKRYSTASTIKCNCVEKAAIMFIYIVNFVLLINSMVAIGSNRLCINYAYISGGFFGAVNVTLI